VLAGNWAVLQSVFSVGEAMRTYVVCALSGVVYAAAVC